MRSVVDSSTPVFYDVCVCELERKLLIFAGFQCESLMKDNLGVSSVPSNYLSRMILH